MKNREPIILFFIFSILFHLVLFLFGIGPAARFSEQLQKKNEEPVDITLLDKGQYQIADIAPPEKQERPDKAKFVGVYDSRVEEEQVAPTRKPSSGSGSEAASPPQKKVDEEKVTEKKETKTETPEEKSDDTVPTEKKVAKKEPKEKPVSQGGGGPGDFNDSGLPEDYFPNYKMGEHTYLNVLRFPKVSYFVRLKKIFNTTWNPRSALMYSGMNQLAKGQVEVVLGVTVDRNGNLSELFVINSSGLTTYDNEAQRTIKDSSPFASPPAELLDKTSRLRMVWTFTVYM